MLNELYVEVVFTYPKILVDVFCKLPMFNALYVDNEFKLPNIVVDVLFPLLINVNISEPETFNDDKHVAFLHVKLYGLMLYIPELLIFII
jgi:hypothetical protein